MLTIRLQRAGKTNRPEFSIVVAEKQAAADKKFVEVLGHYNPRTKAFSVKQDRVDYWLSQHATMSPTLNNLLIDKEVIKGTKVKAFSVPKKSAEPAVPEVKTETPAEATAETSPESTTETTENAPDTQPEPVEAPAEATNP